MAKNITKNNQIFLEFNKGKGSNFYDRTLINFYFIVSRVGFCRSIEGSILMLFFLFIPCSTGVYIDYS